MRKPHAGTNERLIQCIFSCHDSTGGQSDEPTIEFGGEGTTIVIINYISHY